MTIKRSENYHQQKYFGVKNVGYDIGLHHGLLHNHGGDSFFQKAKSLISPKLKLKSILQFYKDLLEIESCLLDTAGRATIYTTIFFQISLEN